MIIINNGSTDQTETLIKYYKFKNNKYYQLEKPDLVDALDFGVNHAKGEYIARMDAHDISHSDRLFHQAQYLDKHPDIGLVSGLVNYKGNTVTK